MKQTGPIAFITQHRVAYNLLMIIMLLAGIWALQHLNTQFLPNFSLDRISIQIPWPGASAEDVETNIIVPVEQAVRDIQNIKQLTSTAKQGMASVNLELQDNADLNASIEDVKNRMAQIRNLPQRSETPEIIRATRYERIAKLVITAPKRLETLRPWVKTIKSQLLARGIAKVRYRGLPRQEMAILVPSEYIAALQSALPTIGQKIVANSQDRPAGRIGHHEVTTQIRSLSQRRTPKAFEQMQITDAEGQVLRLHEIADVQLRPRDQETLVYHQGKPAVEIELMRSESADALASADILDQWRATFEPTLPAGFTLTVYDTTWKLIQERIDLLLKNGAGGLILIIIILFLFLNGRVAFWVAASIPISFMAALAALYVFGGTINMVSLFALIMSLGIIVDDSIVVGEQALTLYQEGKGAVQAPILAAKQMLPPVMASSLTTIAAFMPLMNIRDTIGNILFAIPLVVICVIIASLIECFLVLPGHLRQSFKKPPSEKTFKIKEKVESWFVYFRDHQFKAALNWAIAHPGTTITIALCALALSFSLIASGRIGFQFFPSPEGTIVHADAQFIAGTPAKKIKLFLRHLEQTLKETQDELQETDPVRHTHVAFLNQAHTDNPRNPSTGDHLASLIVSLTSPEDRDISNQEFIQAWRKKITLPPGIDTFSLYSRRGGPPGGDIDIQLSGATPLMLKETAQKLKQALAAFDGVNNIKDDMPYGHDQLILNRTAQGRLLGLQASDLAEQVHAGFEGRILQIFHQDEDDVEVTIQLPEDERHTLETLQHFPIVTPDNKVVPLPMVASFDYNQGLATLKHTDAKLRIQVSADVDANITNANKVLATLKETVIPQLKQHYLIHASFEGQAASQRDTLADMKTGLVYGLSLIYIILAWIFGSYGWPLVVMAIIPFGLTGALFGHWLMNMDLTILSLFGMFGLTGIVINDSIILVNRYQQACRDGVPHQEAVKSAALARLRAVVLTSMTTIAGLTPLLFETSLQAQFLIPMAVSISFGLAFATLLVLILLPVLLSVKWKRGVVGWL